MSLVQNSWTHKKWNGKQTTMSVSNTTTRSRKRAFEALYVSVSSIAMDTVSPATNVRGLRASAQEGVRVYTAAAQAGHTIKSPPTDLSVGITLKATRK
jgi:hypothetical protein